MSYFSDLGMGVALFGLMQPPPPAMPAVGETFGDTAGNDDLLAFSAPLPCPGAAQDNANGLPNMLGWLQAQMGALMLQLAQLLRQLQQRPVPAATQGTACRPGGAQKGTKVCGPVNGVVSGRFGEARPGHPHGHGGTDIAAAAGAAISAVKGGKVTWAGWQQGYGLCVQVDHGQGLSTFYAHCSRINVRVGQRVGAGACIAKVGSTGHSTGPHLHFEVRRDGVRVDPGAFLARAA